MVINVLIGGDPVLDDPTELYEALDKAVNDCEPITTFHIVYVGTTGEFARNYAEDNGIRYLLYTPDNIFDDLSGHVNNHFAANRSDVAVIVKSKKIVHFSFFKDLKYEAEDHCKEVHII